MMSEEVGGGAKNGNNYSVPKTPFLGERGKQEGKVQGGGGKKGKGKEEGKGGLPCQ